LCLWNKRKLWFFHPGWLQIVLAPTWTWASREAVVEAIYEVAGQAGELVGEVLKAVSRPLRAHPHELVVCHQV
jgi:hypothetical protein